MMNLFTKLYFSKIRPKTCNKSIFGFFTLLSFLGLSSCEEHGLLRKAKWVGIVSNETDYQISIIAYSRTVEQETFYINPKKKLTREFNERELGFTEGIFYFPEGSINEKNRLIDSVVIIFEGKKKIIQYCGGKHLGNCESIPNNLVNLWEKRNQIVDKDGNFLFGYLYKYQISFTKEDYNSAVPF